MSVTLPRRIGINAIFLLPGMGGLDTYVQEFVPELVRAAPQIRINMYCSPAGEQYLRSSDWAAEVEFVGHRLLGRRGLKAVSEVTLLGLLAGRRVDLIHSVALTAPAWTPAANVVTVADTTWLHGARPDLTTQLWRVVVPPVARRADRIIAISNRGAQDIVEHLRIPRERIDVTLLGHRSPPRPRAVSSEQARRRFELGQNPVALMVGTRKPHKNVLRLLEAMPSVLATQPDALLVLAGNPTAHEAELLAAADRLALGGHVRFLPFVTADDLEDLYAAADCFVLPSVNEGFGLPILEAMGRGLPVACSNTSALPEVAGDAARLFDPTSQEDIAAALIELLRDDRLREDLRARGRRRESELSWEATAAATLESYARAWHAHRTLRR